MTVIREVTIGNCRLIQGDCLAVMPTLGKVDAVDIFDAVVFNQAHEKSAKRQHRPPARGDEDLGAASSRDVGFVCQRGDVARANGDTLRGDLARISEGPQSYGHSLEIKGQAGREQSEFQARSGSHDLPGDGEKGRLHYMRDDGKLVYPSQGRGPLQQHARQLGSDVHGLPFIDAQDGVVAFPQDWAILTDPPYGIGADRNTRANKQHGKAAAPSKDYGQKNWDNKAPDMRWAAQSGVSAIVWGGNYFCLPPSAGWLVWDKENGSNGYADCELAWTNLSQAVRRLKWRWAGMLQQNMADKEDRVHPTQKPVALMEWCLGFMPNAQTILDPFMGSGTTGVACVNLGRSFIGIELDPGYFDIAVKRITDAHKQADFFVEKPAPVAPKQESLL